MTTNVPTYHGDVDACAEAIIERVGPNVVFGSPLALGRPAHIVNALYRRAAADRGIQLTILGGLSIARPKPSRDLERRFVEPLIERLFGDFPELEYIEPYARGTLPPNVDVSEFFLRAGAFMHAATAQQEYIRSNYTHVGRDLLIQGLNVFGQCVARRSEGGRTTFSLSSNGDALDILPQVRARAEEGAAMINVCQVNQRLPFMPHDAEVPEGTFDVVLDDRRYDHALLGTPSLPIGSADYAIGLNELFGHEALATVQRRHARFMNSVMMMSALGSATSDGLESGTVVSGVGGQYNFVAQAHALPGARSVLMLRAAREKGGKVTSNIVWHYGHTTIPRHLRDVVITEYGVADLRGKRDREVVAALVEIANARFQDSLVASAKEAGKLPDGYRVPERCRDNTPERIERALAGARARGCLPRFAFGSELTSEELVLSGVLKGLAAKASSKMGLARMVVGAVDLAGEAPEAAQPYLARLGLDAPSGLQERMLQRLVVSELRAGGHV